MGTACTAATVSKTNGKALVIEGLEAALEALKSDAEGFTTAELRESTGWSINLCRTNLRKLMSAGKVEMAGHKTIKRIDGIQARVPAYRAV